MSILEDLKTKICEALDDIKDMQFKNPNSLILIGGAFFFASWMFESKPYSVDFNLLTSNLQRAEDGNNINKQNIS